MRSAVTLTASALPGLLAGAMLLIAVALVPIWQSLEPTEFARWFRDNSLLIGRLMLPLGMGAAIFTVAAAWVTRRRTLALAAALTVFAVATYPLYFAAANESIMSGSLDASHVAAELARWKVWHWVRTTSGMLAFLLSLQSQK